MDVAVLQVGELLSVGGGLCSTRVSFCELIYVLFLPGLVEPWCAQPAGWTLSLLMFFSVISSSAWVSGRSGGLKVSDLSNVASLLFIDFYLSPGEVFRFKMTCSESWPIHKIHIEYHYVLKVRKNWDFGAQKHTFHHRSHFKHLFTASHGLLLPFSSGVLPQTGPKKANIVYCVRRKLTYPLRLCIHTFSAVCNEP